MNILYPIGRFYPDQTGGPSNTVYWMAKALSKQGHKVIVVTTDYGLRDIYPTNEWVNVDKIKVRYCTHCCCGFQPYLIWHGLKCLPKVEIVHLTSIKSIFSFFIAFFAIMAGKKVIWSPRGELANAANVHYVGFGAIMRRIYLNFVKILFQYKVIFHSTADKETAEIKALMPNAEIIQISNYMELPEKLPYCDKNQILYIGRINPIKKLENLIEALSISEVFLHSNMVLTIAGIAFPTFYESYLEGLKEQANRLGIAHRVKFVGPVVGDEKQQLFASSYCSFLVSDSENFGNVVIEAMAQGTPVVTSLGTPWGILKEKKVGYHITNDPKSLAQAIDELLSLSNKDYIELRKRTYSFCLDNFSIYKNVRIWEQAYGELIKG